MTEPERPVADWPQDEPWAQVAETHAAVVFLVGERACKLKKPVNLGFLDFSTAEARAAACTREVELNRTFASDVYLGVAEIRGPDGQVCDHLVVMRRMPAARRLSTLVRSRAPVAEPLRQVARIIAAQHAEAARGPQIAEQGSRDALRRRWADNIEQTREIQARLAPREPLDPAVIDETERLASRFLAGRAPLLDARIREGRIVDGHGDLLADDIFCLDDGPRILDCLDFDDRLRWVDGLDDVAFLAMDLERLGAPELAEQFMAGLCRVTRGPGTRVTAASLRRLPGLRPRQDRLPAGRPGRPGGRLRGAPAWPRWRCGTCARERSPWSWSAGCPGTGKSALAGAVAGRLGFTVLNSDRIRKELAGLPAETSARAALRAGHLHSGVDRAHLPELLRRAAALLARGESVIADASFISAAQRTAAAATATEASADLLQLGCTASPELAARRMSARPRGLSDADQAVAEEMRAIAEPWPDAMVIDTERGGTAGLPGECLEQVLAAIRPHGPEHVWRPTRPYMLPG